MKGDFADRLRRQLARLGRAWTSPIEHHASIGSTNDRVKEIAASGAPEWSVVVADRQTAGRGRQGRRWRSESGDLFLSVLLRPTFEAERAMLLPMAAALAVCDALEPFGLRAQLKWPNDVLADGRKLAGVLAEGVTGAKGLEAVAVGIGVNLALDPSRLPELGEAATSVRALTGIAPALEEAAARTLAALVVWYDALAREGASRVLSAWRARAVPWWGRTVEVVSAGQRVHGVAVGLDERGALLLETADGSVVSVLAGEAREARPLAHGERRGDPEAP